MREQDADGYDGSGVSGEEDLKGRPLNRYESRSSGIDFEKHFTRENTIPRVRANIVECAADPS